MRETAARPLCPAMTAVGHKRTLRGHLGHVRFTPQSGHTRATSSMSALCQLQTHAAANEVCGCNALFDPLVGAREQRPRNFKTIKLMTRSKFGRLLDRD